MIKLLMVSSVFLVNSCSELNQKVGLKDDNDIENKIEELIEDQTGVRVDFTPNEENEKD